MARQRSITHDYKIVGVVYKYTSPSGKSYIGQTTNEANRRRTWFCMKRRYAGYTIEKARQKYGPENFEYEVLFKQVFSTFEEAMEMLDKMEVYYIGLYDTFNNGYNNTVGGLFPEKGIQAKFGDRLISKDAAIHRADKRRYHEHHTREEINQLRKETNRRRGYWQKIFQFDLDGNFLREFASAGEAVEWLKKGSTMNIKRACKTLGKYYGYNWRFAEDGYVMKAKVPKPKKPKKQYVCKGRHTKAVAKYDKDGILIKAYNSIKEAMADNGIKYCSSISECLSGNSHTSGGFIWKYIVK